MTFEIKFVQELVRCLIYRDNGNDWNLNVVHFNQPLSKIELHEEVTMIAMTVIQQLITLD